MIPHIRIHRGSDYHRPGERQIHRCEEVVSDAVGEFRKDVGGSRGYQQQVRLL